MKITEVRIVEQDWYETELNKTGWDSFGWVFKDSGSNAEAQGWEVVQILEYDKFVNPILGIAEKISEI